MNQRIRRRAAAVVLLAGVVSAMVGAAAWADRAVQTDPAVTVWRNDGGDEPTPTPTQPQPTQTVVPTPTQPVPTASAQPTPSVTRTVSPTPSAPVTPAPSASVSPGPSLPVTGSKTTWLWAAGAMLVLAGVVMLWAVRTRRV